MSYKKKGYTIIELLITFTIFTAVAMISVVVLSNILASSKKIRAQIFLYTETEALMDVISNDIQRNTIDYEGYYARLVLGESGWAGSNYGSYDQTFIHPGSGGGPVATGPYSGIGGYGAFCSATGGTYPDDCPGAIPLTSSLDTDSGTHPFTGITSINPSFVDDPTYMNAMCESDDGSTDCDAIKFYKHDELMLINGDGDERIVIVREILSASVSDYRLSRVVLIGNDTDGDGLEDDWNCSSNYTCNGGDGGPDIGDLTDSDQPPEDFVPISPSAIHIEEFYLFITPLEDPYRAFGEASFDTQIQPQVTIIIRATLSDNFSQGLIGNTPSIMVQRTISTGVYSEVQSYE